jgi:hypothetical protein
VLVNLCNVLAVLWSAQAGRKLAFYVIDAAVATDPVQAAITTTIRLIVVLVFGLVAVGCGYALYTLYLSSPVFLCEFGQPTFLGVQISGLTEVREGVPCPIKCGDIRVCRCANSWIRCALRCGRRTISTSEAWCLTCNCPRLRGRPVATFLRPQRPHRNPHRVAAAVGKCRLSAS